MKAVVRIIAILLGVVVALFGALAAYLAFVFDPNDYREQISQQVEKRTGRKLTIDGDIGLSVFPWLGVGIGQASLGNAAGFGDAPFASVGQVEVRAQLMPLLRSEVEVDRIVLRELKLDLVIDEQGKSNWQDLAGVGGEEAPDTTGSPAGDGAAALAGLVISGVEIESARVSYADRQAGTEYVIDKLSLQTGEVSPGKRFPLELGFDVTSSEPQMAGRVDIAGNALFELAGPSGDIEGFTLRFNATGTGLPGGKADVELSSRLAFDLAAGTANIDGMELSGYGVKALGSFAAKDVTGAPAVTGTLEVPTFDPAATLSALGVEAPQVTDPAVFKRVSLKTRVEGTTSSVALRDLTVVLDDSNLSGEVTVADFAKQAVRFDLALDAINVDRYLPPSSAGASAQPAAGTPAKSAGTSSSQPAGSAARKASGGAEALVDPAMLRGLDIVGKLRVGKLVASGLTMTDISLDVRAQDGVVRVAPLAALYGGRYAGNITLDGRGQALAVALDESLKGIQVGPLLRDLNGAEERLTGNANILAKLQLRGNDVDAMKRTLGGNVDFRFLDGAVKGINIAQYLREAQARISGQPVPQTSEPNQTDFSQLTGTLQIANGVARNEDLDARSPLLRVGGKGSVNIPAETIDYTVRASVVATLSGQGGEGLDKLKGVTVPIKVAGTFDKPSFRLDVEGLVSDAAKQQAQEKLKGALEEKLGPKLDEQGGGDLKETLKKGLGGLLGR